MTDWCILRTSGRHTIPLTEALQRAKFECWTPAVQIPKRTGPGRARVDIPAPMLPTYAFAKADRLTDLAELANAERKDCPDFSVFHYLGRVPVIADCELSHLRMVELRKGQRREQQRTFGNGDRVSVQDGPWIGMSGIIECRKRKFFWVKFPGYKHSAKIAGFLLLPENPPPLDNNSQS